MREVEKLGDGGGGGGGGGGEEGNDPQFSCDIDIKIPYMLDCSYTGYTFKKKTTLSHALFN